MYNFEWYVIVNELERKQTLSKYFLEGTEEKCVSLSLGRDLNSESLEYGEL
jgi:hypothetical protein